ncbi:unnamed protein product [Calypogeia fissa]
MGLLKRPLGLWRTVKMCSKMWGESSAVTVGGLGWERWARGMATSTALRVFMVAGEPSGDAIGSRLMASLRCLSSAPLEFGGVGGPLMEKQGLPSRFPMEDISVMGAVELIPYAFRLRARLRETVAAALEFQPNVVITVDAKGFSFRVLNGLRDAYSRLGQSRPPTVHYVAPSFWAWKGGAERLKNLAKIVDLMLCILPFEEAVCQANGLTAKFVGHPVLEDAHSAAANGKTYGDSNWHIEGDGAHFRDCHGIDAGATVLSVLPGSRIQEVHRMLPIFKDALSLLATDVPNLTVVIPTVQSQILVQSIEAVVGRWNVPVVMLPGASDTDKYNAFAASNAGLCTSGTAVVQLLMSRVPCVVAYRAHLLTEWLIRYRTKLQFISLPNILLDSAVIPESLFGACTPTNLVSQLRPLLENESLQRKQVVSAGEVLKMLAPPSSEYTRSSRLSGPYMSEQPALRPSAAAALAILRLIGGNSGFCYSIDKPCKNDDS